MSRRVFRALHVAVAGLCAAGALAQPVPQVSANGGRGEVIALPGQAVEVAIALSAGSFAGAAADWWLVAGVGGAFYGYSLVGGWTPALGPTYQGALASFPATKLLTLPGLPSGQLTLYFGVDRQMNGAIDAASLSASAVTVTVPAWSCPAVSRDSRTVLSEVQRQFIAARGNPRLFTISFLTEAVGAGGTRQVAAAPRRIESWVYDRQGLVADLFDNGHFVAETSHGGSGITWPAAHVGPAQFSPCMSRTEVVALLGPPSCTLSGEYGGRSLQTLRYTPTVARPAVTLVLENGLLASVMAGYSYVAPEQTGTDLCKAP